MINTNDAGAGSIAHNGDDSVTVESGDGNSVLRNSIHDNSNLGIDLGADGSTANDANDVDTGANALQNGPEIESATVTTDANGNADDTTALAVPPGHVTITATRSMFGGVFPNLALTPHETSEFAPCEEVA